MMRKATGKGEAKPKSNNNEIPTADGLLEEVIRRLDELDDAGDRALWALHAVVNAVEFGRLDLAQRALAAMNDAPRSETVLERAQLAVGEAHRRAGDRETALRIAEEVLETVDMNTENSWYPLSLIRSVAELQLRCGADEQALETASLIERIQDLAPEKIAEAYGNVGLAAPEQQGAHEAYDRAVKRLRGRQRTHDWRDVAKKCLILACRLGRVDDAIEFGAEAHQLGEVAGELTNLGDREGALRAHAHQLDYLLGVENNEKWRIATWIGKIACRQLDLGASEAAFDTIDRGIKWASSLDDENAADCRKTLRDELKERTEFATVLRDQLPSEIPNEVYTRLDRAAELGRSGKVEEAVALVEQALAEDGCDEDDGRNEERWSSFYAAIGDLDNARQWHERATPKVVAKWRSHRSGGHFIGLHHRGFVEDLLEACAYREAVAGVRDIPSFEHRLWICDKLMDRVPAEAPELARSYAEDVLNDLEESGPGKGFDQAHATMELARRAIEILAVDAYAEVRKQLVARMVGIGKRCRDTGFRIATISSEAVKLAPRHPEVASALFDECVNWASRRRGTDHLGSLLGIASELWKLRSQ